MPDTITETATRDIVTTLSNEGSLLRSIVNDFTPSASNSKPGFSFGSAFRSLGFAIRHPMRAFRLGNAARKGVFTSPSFIDEAFNNKDLRKLASENSKTVAGALYNMRELPALKTQLEAYKVNPELLKTAVPAVLEHLDESKIILDNFMTKDKDGKKKPFMQNLHEFLTIGNNYPEFKKFVDTNSAKLTEITKAYLNSSPEWTKWTDQMGLNSGILDLMPALLADPKVAQDIIGLNNAKDFDSMISLIMKTAQDPNHPLHKGFQQVAKDGKLSQLIFDIVTKNPDLAAYVKDIGVGEHKLKQVSEIVSILFDDPQNLGDIWQLLKEKKHFELIDKVLDLAANNPKLSSYLQENANLFQDIVIKYFDKNPQGKKLMAELGLNTDDITKLSKIIPALIGEPKKLANLFKLFKEGKYIDLTEAVLKDSSLSNFVSENANLFEEIARNVIKNNPQVNTQLQTLGLKTEDVKDLVRIVPLLITKPEKLISLIKLVKEGKYLELTENILDLAASDEKLRGYLISNGQTFKKIAEKILTNNDAVNKQLEKLRIPTDQIGKISEIVPILLSEPHNLLKALKHFKNGDNAALVAHLLNTAKHNDGLKKYLDDVKPLISTALSEYIKQTPEAKIHMTGMDVEATITGLVDSSMHSSRFADVVEMVNNRNWVALPGAIASVATESSSVATVKTAAQVATRATANRGGWSGWAASWFCDNSYTAQRTKEASDLLVGEKDSQGEGLKTLKDYGTAFDGVHFSPEKLDPTKELKRNTSGALDLGNVSIENCSFVNTQFSNVSFKAAKLTNTSFLGASFDDKTSFAGATIDAETLKSLADPRTNPGKPIKLNGAKITGDISGIDLSRFSLTAANFDGVTKADHGQINQYQHEKEANSLEEKIATLEIEEQRRLEKLQKEEKVDHSEKDPQEKISVEEEARIAAHVAAGKIALGDKNGGKMPPSSPHKEDDRRRS